MVGSTEMLQESASRQESEDTKEMVQWRGNSQEGIVGLWKELCDTLEEDVMDKCKGGRRKEGCFSRTW